MRIIEGIFPNCLEIRRVISIFKSGREDQTTNYGLITTLHILAKIFEKLAYKRMNCFINRFNLPNSNQFGFLAGKNTYDAQTEFLDKAYDAIIQNRVFLTIFLDLSKAFNTVGQEVFNQQRSSSLDVNIGAPQGSMLDLLLFILYIDDLNTSLLLLKSIHFANDTTLYLYISPTTDHTSLINFELVQVQT